MLTDICRSQLNDRNNDFAFHNEATESFDCNVAMCSEAVQLVNGRRLSASVTRRLGLDQEGGTGTRLARNVFRSQGFSVGTDFLTMNGWPTEDIRDLLAKKWWVVAYIHYRTMRNEAPNVVGDGDYNDAHAVGLGDLWRNEGLRWTHYYDPLNDGRKSASLGHDAPDGPQSVHFHALRDAAWAYSEIYEKARTGRGSGYIYGYAVKPT